MVSKLAGEFPGEKETANAQSVHLARYKDKAKNSIKATQLTHIESSGHLMNLTVHGRSSDLMTSCRISTTFYNSIVVYDVCAARFFLIDSERNEPTDDSRLLTTLLLARVYIMRCNKASRRVSYQFTNIVITFP